MYGRGKPTGRLKELNIKLEGSSEFVVRGKVSNPDSVAANHEYVFSADVKNLMKNVI